MAAEERIKQYPYEVPDDGTIWSWGWNNLMPNWYIDMQNAINRKLGITDSNPVGEFLGNIGDFITGETAKNQNMELQNAANKFTTEEREAAQKFNALEAKKARDFQGELQLLAQQFNHDEAELNRQWQEQMSNTAYQRATADMRAAGLNPYLAYAQGGAPMSSSQSASVGVSASPSASVNAGQGKQGSVSSTVGAVVGIISSIASTALGVANLLGNNKTTTTRKIGF